MLELKNISFSVEEEGHRHEILNDISLTLEDGKLYVITGPNGSGKSTLAKVIIGLEPLSAGQIIFNGQDISNLSITERAKLGISYAFQQPPRFKGLTVREMLEIAAGRPIPETECSNFLTEVGICPRDYIGRELDSSLSGGEMKRIEIATSLARNTAFSIYDEPEAGIDLWSFSKLTETFRSVHEQQKGTIVIISHQERILELADEIILLADGKIQQQDKRDTMLSKIMGDISCPKNCVMKGAFNNELCK